ncbi:MAG: cold shock domain-containing protein [Chloroflexi bacterium]|jgi:CspA family cold shock protein|nr:cold shock domain-containing protein [Chloroflexota bacterium]
MSLRDRALFRDRLLTCRSCGIRFLYSAEQQRQQAEEPECCPGCLALEAWLERQEPPRRRGTVRWYDTRKGYGFIRDEEGHDVFVHRSAFRHQGRLRPGQRVEYTVIETERGPAAEKVVRVTE